MKCPGCGAELEYVSFSVIGKVEFDWRWQTLSGKCRCEFEVAIEEEKKC